MAVGSKVVPVSQEEYTHGYFDLMAHQYILGDGWSTIRIRDVITQLRPEVGDRILDAGCAHGVFSIESRKRGAGVVGMDYAAEALKQARVLSGFILREKAPTFARASVAHLPFKDRTFNKIVSADVIEHITPEEFARFGEECYRVLDRQGIAVIYTPNPASAGEKLRGEAKTSEYGGGKTRISLKGAIDNLLKPIWDSIRPLLRYDEKITLQKRFNIPPVFPILHSRQIAYNQEQYDYLHVDLKDPVEVKGIFESKGFITRRCVVTRSGLWLQKLPFPLNLYWGGSVCFVFEKR